MPDDIKLPITSKTLHLDKRAGRIAEQREGRLDELLTEKQLADWFGVSDQWPQQARIYGYGPPCVVMGPKFIRYRRDAVMEWLKAREVKSTAQARELKKARMIRRT